jgi:NADPH:quinone reductase-like Zn-dependent oxidoreductase
MTTIKETMQALVLEEFSSPFVRKTLDRPIPKKGEVLVKIIASGVNPLDTKIWSGKAGHAQQPLPAILGLDMAGVVVAVGDGVNNFKPGDEVYGLTGGVACLQGSLAEYAAVDARLLALKPANLTMREAAAVPLVFITAWEGLVDRAHVHHGQKVLVHAGAGGVGHMAIQVAKAFSAEVFATVSPDKQEIAKSFGATPIDYTTTTVTEYVEKHTAGIGFDIAYDTLGGATLDASFAAVRTYDGHVISSLGWGSHSLAPLSFRGATYSGVFTLLPMLTGQYREHHGEILREATKLIEAGLVRPLMDKREFTLDSVLDAYTAIEQQTAVGKLVINVQ